MKQRPLHIRTLVPMLLLLTGVALPIGADTSTTSSRSVVRAPDPIKAKRLDDPSPVAVAGVLEDGLEGHCSLLAMNRGKGRRGVRVTLEAVLIDANTGTELEEFSATHRTDKRGEVGADFQIERRGNFSQLVALAAQVDVGGGKKVTDIEFSCQLVDSTP